jgi:hypothetical protein
MGVWSQPPARGSERSPWPQEDSKEVDPAGRWNGLIGRALLLAGFLWAAWLDPWSLSEADPGALPGSARMAARQAQAVVVGMAFLQLIVEGALGLSGVRPRGRRTVAWLTGLGALLYSAGYTLATSRPPGVWLIPAGALLNFIGFAVLLGLVGRGRVVWRVVLPIVCLGMLLDAVMGLFTADPDRFLPAFLGPEDGVRLRMLRLARAAAVALPAVALLYEGLAYRVGLDRPVARCGRVLLWVGVATMSAVLAGAAFTSVRVKFLLPLPALTTFAGTCAGVALAYGHARRLETWGWLLVASSMAAGLLIGLYAFDGPLPAPAIFDGYNDFARRLTRLGHAYCIVLGLLSIFIARESDAPPPEPRVRRVGVALLVAGSVLTLLVISLAAASVLSTAWLSAGPALVAGALVLCLSPPRGVGREGPMRDTGASVRA